MFFLQIKISYIDLMNSRDTRQAELMSTYYFLCECEKCKEPEPLTESAICPEMSCSKYCDINENNCSHCGRELSKELVEKFEEARDFTENHLQNMRSMACILLSKIYKKIFIIFFKLLKLLRLLYS